jgi:hypothetical protein
VILISSTAWAQESEAEPESSGVAADMAREPTAPETGEPPPGEGWRDGRGQTRLRESWRALSPEERRAFRRHFGERRRERRAFRELPGPERRALRRHLMEVGPEERRRFRQLSLEEKGAVVERLREQMKRLRLMPPQERSALLDELLGEDEPGS